MSSSASSATVSTIPVTFSHEASTLDIALPLHVPLSDIVPTVVDELGLLTPLAASGGFRVLDEVGTEIALEQTAATSDVQAGDILTIEPIGKGEGDRRYDDLVEALGTAVESRGDGWNSTDSLRTCIAAGALLLLVVAVVLWNEGGILGLAAGLGSAVVAISVAVVIARLNQPIGAILMHCTGGVLLAAGAVALLDDPSIRLMVAAGALILTGALGFVTLRLPAGHHAKQPDGGAMVGPIYAGVMLLWAGAAQYFLALDAQLISVTIVTITALVMILVPWIALAHTPVRSYIPRTDDERARDREVFFEDEVKSHADSGRVIAITLKITGGLVLLFAMPPLVNGGIAGLVLIGAVGASLLLNTRQVYARSEVLIGIIAGSAVLMEGTILVAMRQPEHIVWIVWTVIVVAGLVLVLGALNRQFSSTVGRWADTLSVLALLAIIPAAALASGLI